METQTPIMDAAIDRVYGGSGTPDSVSRNPITDAGKRMERDRAALIAALTTCGAELQTLAPRLSGQYRANIQAAADLARAALAAVQS